MSLLSGPIKNALERGESIDQIKQSFLNASYSQEDIQTAINEINEWQRLQSSVPAKPEKATSGYKVLPSINANAKKENYWRYMLLGIICLLILIGAVVLGLYWNKLF